MLLALYPAWQATSGPINVDSAATSFVVTISGLYSVGTYSFNSNATTTTFSLNVISSSNYLDKVSSGEFTTLTLTGVNATSNKQVASIATVADFLISAADANDNQTYVSNATSFTSAVDAYISYSNKQLNSFTEYVLLNAAWYDTQSNTALVSSPEDTSYLIEYSDILSGIGRYSTAAYTGYTLSWVISKDTLALNSGADRMEFSTGGYKEGTAVNEIPFKLTGVTMLTASIASSELKANTSVTTISASIDVHEASAEVTPEKITIMESC